jgi:hypothetical protein
MFLKPDEHMIVMNTNAASGLHGMDWIDLTTRDLTRLREECGITVAHEYLYWNLIEVGKGQYDWGLADRQVKRCLDAGMRLIICSPISVPDSLDESLYAATFNGAPFKQILSFWNPVAREYQRNFLQTLIQRYGSSDVTIVYTGFLGEHYLWNTPVYYDKAARDSYRQMYGVDLPSPRNDNTLSPEVEEWLAQGVVDHCLAMHEITVGQHNEVWDTTQHGIGIQSPHNGVYARPRVLEAYQRRWPDATRWLLQYTYWGHGPGNAAIVDDLLERYDCKTIVEAHYCKGLAGDPSTATHATEGGIHRKNPERWCGQVVCPLHPFGDEKQLRQWMMDAMRNAVDIWRARDEAGGA